MSNLNYALSKIYNNLFTYFKYKHLISLDEKLNDNEFIKNIFNDEYFIIKTVSNSYSDEEIDLIKNNLDKKNFKRKDLKITFIIIFHYNSEIYTKTQELKKVIQKFKKVELDYDIIIITKNSISTNVNNFLESIKPKINIIPYTFKLFTIIIPEHILSNKHEILNNEETNNLLTNILYCKKHNLPKIKITDPQIIWSIGKVDDVVKITRYDDITGISIYYRVII